MREIGEYIAVVDQIVDSQQAVLIVGEPPEKEITVARDHLPEGIEEGHWLRIRLEGDQLIDAAINLEATERAGKRVRDKMEQLRRRGRGLGET